MPYQEFQSPWYQAPNEYHSPWQQAQYMGTYGGYQPGMRPGTPGWDRMISDEERRNAPDTSPLADYWANNFSGNMKPEAESIFMAMFGDGGFNSGDIGGVDRQYSGGVMNEYQGIGDANFNMGEMMNGGSNRISRWGGTGAMDFYALDPTFKSSMEKTVRWDQAPSLYNMWMHPWDAERWGDYLPGSDRERAKILGDRGYRPRNANRANEIANKYRPSGRRHT